MPFRILRGNEELAIINERGTAEDAIDSYVRSQFPNVPQSAGWSLHDFLKYQLRAEWIEPKPQYRLSALLWVMTMVAVAVWAYSNFSQITMVLWLMFNSLMPNLANDFR